MKLNLGNVSALILILCFSSFKILNGQVTAGSVPAGTSVLHPAIELSIEGYQVDSIAFIDINCDGSNDFSFRIYQGYPPSNEDNFAQLKILNDSFSICTSSNLPDAVKLYNSGDTLCASGSQWSLDSLLILGCYGYNCAGLDQWYENNRFIAFRNNFSGAIGWIEINMSLFSEKTPQPITLSIPETLVLCQINSIQDEVKGVDFSTYPNPTVDGILTIKSDDVISSIMVIDSNGKLINTYPGHINQLTLPTISGMYLVFARIKTGPYQYKRILKL